MTNDETARMLLEAVIEGGEPVASDEMGNVFCLWCEAAKLDDGTRFVHPAACTWSRIRVFLAREAPAPPVEEPALIRDHEFKEGPLSRRVGAAVCWCGASRARHVQASTEEPKR